MDPLPGPGSTEPQPTRPVYGDVAPTEIEQNKDARMWGMLAHLSCLVCYLGVPSFLGPLVVWLIKKEEYPFVDDQGKEALNFHICVMIVAAIAIPAIFVF